MLCLYGKRQNEQYCIEASYEQAQVQKSHQITLNTRKKVQASMKWYKILFTGYKYKIPNQNDFTLKIFFCMYTFKILNIKSY